MEIFNTSLKRERYRISYDVIRRWIASHRRCEYTNEYFKIVNLKEWFCWRIGNTPKVQFQKKFKQHNVISRMTLFKEIGS
jgi:hypothetical protein